MATSRVVTRAPDGDARALRLERDPDLLTAYLDDAARFPGGRLDALARPRSEAEVAAVLTAGARVLPVGARSSLTGGATPDGGVVLSTERLTGVGPLAGDHIRVGAGVTLQALQEDLAPRGRWCPPVPTWLGATAGGAVATCAAGAATFKYGTMRPWIDALTVVLASGRVLDVARGAVQASPDGFLVEAPRGTIRVPIRPLPWPEVPKRAAGYALTDGMDLVDLFIGAEGTLGVVTDVTLRTAPRPPATLSALVPLPDESAAIALAGALRDAARATWADGDARGLDVAAIEHIDHRSLDVLREDGALAALGVGLPPGAGTLLLVSVELPEALPDAWEAMGGALEPGAADGPLTRLVALLAAHGALDDTRIALPGDTGEAARFAALREAVPAAVNRRVARARAEVDARIHKTAGDMIVPFHRFGTFMTEARALFAARALDLAVWGHISDGNVHPNVIPHRYEDVAAGDGVMLALADLAIALGGCPLAEHGVGRHPAKQAMLRRLHGDGGLAAMRQVKHALDPAQQLAPGVLWPAAGSG